RGAHARARADLERVALGQIDRREALLDRRVLAGVPAAVPARPGALRRRSHGVCQPVDHRHEGRALGGPHALRRGRAARLHGLPVHRAHAVGAGGRLWLLQPGHGAAVGSRRASARARVAPGRQPHLPLRRALLLLRGTAALQGEVRSDLGAALSRGSRGDRAAAGAGGRVGADRRRCEGAVHEMILRSPRSLIPRALLIGAGACAPPPTAPAAAAPAPAAPAPAPAAGHAPRAHPPTADNIYATHLPSARFGAVTVYIPAGAPRGVALFLSGDGGWELGVVGMARALAAMGAVVIGADIRQYLGSLRRAAYPGAPCQMIAADFEALSHQVQKEIGMSDYHVPVLIGYSSGATVVYAALVESPPGTFAGALSLGFCPDQDFAGAALCPGAGLRYRANERGELVLEPAANLKQPWIALQGQKDQVCEAHAADEFASRTAHGEVVRLPLVGHGFGVERNWMPQFRDAYARLIVPAESAPPRPPEISDLPVIEERVLLIGYSFGADVLPFVVNRLPPELRARVASVSLLGIDSNASFEIRIADWVGSDDRGPPTRPELARLGAAPVLCIYGEGESDSICPELAAGNVERAQIGRGHHFSGEYATIADRILEFARRARP